MEEIIGSLAVLTVVSVVLKQAVALVRRYVTIEGGLVVLTAVVIGFVLAWFFDLQITEALTEGAGLPVGRDLPVAVDWLVAAVAATAVAGFFHDREKALAASSVAQIEPHGGTVQPL